MQPATKVNLIARLTDTGRAGMCRFVARTIRPDFSGGVDYVAAQGNGIDAAEAVMDLKMQVAGDDFETVTIRVV